MLHAGLLGSTVARASSLPSTAASYNASSVCDCAIRRRHTLSRAMQAEKEAAADVDEVTWLRGYVDANEVTANTSLPTAIIEEK